MDFETGNRLRAAAAALAQATVALDYAERPILRERYGEKGRFDYLRDILHNVNYLSAAIDVEEPGLFTDYVTWAKTVLVSRPPVAAKRNQPGARTLLQQCDATNLGSVL